MAAWNLDVVLNKSSTGVKQELLIKNISENDFETTCKLMEQEITNQGFSLLHIHDVKETLAKKGIELGKQAKIFEICNGKVAKKLMDYNFEILVSLPCRICVFNLDNGKVEIVTLKSVDLFAWKGVNECRPLSEQVDQHLEALISAVCEKKN